MQVKVLEYKHNESDKLTHKTYNSNHFLRLSKNKINCAQQQHQYYQTLAIKLVLSFNNKNISKDTQFLAISYINFMEQKSLLFNS